MTGTIKQTYGESIQSSVQAWPGTALKFSIPQSNHTIYCLVAKPTANSIVVDYIINRTDGVKAMHLGTLSPTYAYADGILTVTLNPSDYYAYSFTRLSSYN